MSAARYIPALRFGALTRFYDPVIAATTRERVFKSRLIEQAALAPGMRVLDLACGTGTLAIAMAQREPRAQISGIDGDPAILAIARLKAERAGVAVVWHEGLSTGLPFAPASFERVTSSLFFHHLETADKVRSFAEVLRVLIPGGELHVADWGAPQNALMRIAFVQIRLLDGFSNTVANALGALPQLMREAGFCEVRTRAEIPTMYGTMTLYSAVKSSRD